MQDRCQINAWRETCTMAPVVELVGGALHAFKGSMRWILEKFACFLSKGQYDVKSFTCSVFVRIVMMTKLYFMFTKPFSLCPSWQVLTLAAFHEDVTCDVSSHAPDKTFVINIIIYYILIILQTLVSSLFWEKESGLTLTMGTACPLSLYNEVSYCSLCFHSNYWMLVVTCLTM